ncbi:hypothetical protein [Vibrio sp. CAU 1672]|uniref:hypothetical protein n=1 Tax=Vibrio sp. CAU 1672 TaxID=3032594 RepID=UPI0023DC91C6|nr:hypothetical protein [Vibrio sp. CAU 1672]MDF2152826.1 hypothetical protein [Vibrio sp. CAU 1672]
MITFIESTLSTMLPTIKTHCADKEIFFQHGDSQFRVVKVQPIKMDFECSGVLLAIETGGKITLHNGMDLEYKIQGKEATFTKQAKAELKNLHNLHKAS